MSRYNVGDLIFCEDDSFGALVLSAYHCNYEQYFLIIEHWNGSILGKIFCERLNNGYRTIGKVRR